MLRSQKLEICLSEKNAREIPAERASRQVVPLDGALNETYATGEVAFKHHCDAQCGIAANHGSSRNRFAKALHADARGP